MTAEVSFYPDLNRLRFFIRSDRGFAQIQLDKIPGGGFDRLLFSLPINLLAFLPDGPSSGKDVFQFLSLQRTPMPTGKVPLLQRCVNRSADMERRSWRLLDSRDITEIELQPAPLPDR